MQFGDLFHVPDTVLIEFFYQPSFQLAGRIKKFVVILTVLILAALRETKFPPVAAQPLQQSFNGHCVQSNPHIEQP